MIRNAFILGNPRSGTSLFRLMLNAHTKIASPPECGFIQWWFSKYKSWSNSKNNIEEITKFVNDLLESKKIETWNLDKAILIKYLLKQRPQNYKELTSYIYLAWAEQRGKYPQVAIDKNNYFIHHLNELNEIWPKAKFIFLIRDGRDVATSYLDLKNLKTKSLYKPQLPNRIDEIASEWQKNNLNIFNYLNNEHPNNFLICKYETLVVSPEKTLRKAVQFLNLNYEPRMQLYHLNNEEPLETLDWKIKTLEQPDPLNIGKYRLKLNQQQIVEFNKVADKALKLFNYIQ